jgi:hypothetical protein
LGLNGPQDFSVESIGPISSVGRWTTAAIAISSIATATVIAKAIAQATIDTAQATIVVSTIAHGVRSGKYS